MRLLWIAGALAMGVATTGAAQWIPDERPRERWVAAQFRMDDYAPGGSGVEVGVSAGQRWSRYAVTVGASRLSVGNTSWSVGSVQGYYAVSPALSVRADVLGGPGVQAGNDFMYRRASIGGTAELGAGQVWADAEVYTFSSGAIDGQVVQAGGIVRAARRMIVRASYGRTLAGTLDTDYLAVRSDYLTNSVRLFGGGVLGTALVRPADAGLPVGTARDQVQWFAGVTFPVGRHESTVVLERLNDPNVRRHTVSGGFRWRLP